MTHRSGMAKAIAVVRIARLGKPGNQTKFIGSRPDRLCSRRESARLVAGSSTQSQEIPRGQRSKAQHARNEETKSQPAEEGQRFRAKPESQGTDFKRLTAWSEQANIEPRRPALRCGAVPRFYFHVCNGYGFTEDHEGQELADEAAARAQAIKSAREVMAGDLGSGELDLSSFIEVEEDKHELLFTLTFEDAVTLKRQIAEEAQQRRREGPDSIWASCSDGLRGTRPPGELLSQLSDLQPPKFGSLDIGAMTSDALGECSEALWIAGKEVGVVQRFLVRRDRRFQPLDLAPAAGRDPAGPCS